MDETVTQTYDDVEYKKKRKVPATNKVEIEVTGMGRVQLDLNDGNLGLLQEAVRPFIDAGTKVSGRGAGVAASSGRRSGGRKASTKKGSADGQHGKAAFNAAAREFAQTQPDLVEKGISDRGRLSNEIIDRFKQHEPNWEKKYFLSDADDSAPNAPTQQNTSKQDEDEDNEPVSGGPIPSSGETQNVDEHGWEQEPDTSFAGSYG